MLRRRWKVWALCWLLVTMGLGCGGGGGVKKGLGTTCASNDECASGICLPYLEESICSKSCTTLEDCTKGTSCKDLGMTGSWCVPPVGCTPECGAFECGPDPVCGVSCGDCTGGKLCQDGACVCTSRASSGCYNGDVWWFDSCHNPEQLLSDCQYGCENGQCLSCTPDCSDTECGPDPVCGASCGDCTGGKLCQDGACVCTSRASSGCYNGDVWWFDSCGNPEEFLSDCQYGCENGQCLSCTPDCSGTECGPDPVCGASCGDCTGGKLCQGGACVCTSRASSGCYNGDVWWFDSCGNPEEVYSDCQYGCENGQCLSCTPDCSGTECGPDPVCGTSCGSCIGAETCSATGICGEWCYPGQSVCSTDGYGFRACGPDQVYSGEYSFGLRIPCMVGDGCLVSSGSCQRQACLETEMVFVLDRSSSMSASGAWSWVTGELSETLQERQARNFLGFRQFPSIAGGCTVGALTPLAKQNASAIIGSIRDPDVASATPIQAALQDLKLQYGDANDGQAVVLLTDGDENCGTQAGAIDAAGALWRSGVRVYVIAVTTMANQVFLDQLAQAGGTGASVRVTTAQELRAALDAIYTDIASCRCYSGDKRCESDRMLFTCSADQKSFELAEECNQPPSVCFQGPGSCSSLVCLYPYHDGVACDDYNPCTLNEACQYGACTGGSPKCDDGNDCTIDPCDSQTGQCGIKQNAAAGTPCDDSDPCTADAVCNGSGICVRVSCTQACTWYLDSDGDGFGLTSSTICSSAQPTGYVGRSGDCCDTDNRAYPGESTYFETPRTCGGYDYNCNGAEEARYTEYYYRYCYWYGWCETDGWYIDNGIPDCGNSGWYYMCSVHKTSAACNSGYGQGQIKNQPCR